MPLLTVSALLTDASGMILLVRRKNSALWKLPGGDIGRAASATVMLASLCRRQVGIVPDFVAPLYAFEFAGRRVFVGRDVVRHEQARACGWIEAVEWCHRGSLPVGVEPIAAMAISLSDRPAFRLTMSAPPLNVTAAPAGKFYGARPQTD
jgi:ADP-ribose pyrophosphatase YjhB (NUDIX family)